MKQYLEQTITAICDCIKFDSSFSAPAPSAKMPFGKGAAECLDYYLSLAEQFGFETHNYDHYVGEVVYGNGEDEFAVLSHLDVVPAGKGWTKDPFGGTVEDGKIWGRGAMDDKGPAICALYALKALKDEGFAPSKKIKLIVGCNEESGWRCIEHYNKCAHMPETGFSPDADFPVIYAEKGILQLRLHFPNKGRPFTFLEGGEQANMVCDYCEAIPTRIDMKKVNRLGLVLKNRKIVSYGKSAHGSTPELGKNAILPILKYFDRNPTINRIIECVFDDVYGLKKLNDETGYLTMSPNMIKFRKKQISVTVDIRYPATIPAETVLECVSKFSPRYETIHFQPPLYHSKDSELVKTLAEVYEECTGKKEEPVAIGGGTYARALKNGVAFGPEIRGEESRIHQADEYISVERVELLLNAYKKALERLTK